MDYCKDERPWYIDQRDWDSIRSALGCVQDDPSIIGASIEISVGAPPGNPWWTVSRGQVPPRTVAPQQPARPPPPPPNETRADVPVVVRVFQEDDGQWAVQIGSSIYGALTEAVARRIAANERAKELTVVPVAPNYNPTPAVAVSQSEDAPVGIIEDILGGIEGVGDIVDAYNRTFNPPDMTPPRSIAPPVIINQPPGGGGSTRFWWTWDVLESTR